MSYKVLHQALEKAARLDYIAKNPAAGCELPRSEQEEIHPLDDKQTTALIKAFKGDELEPLVTVALFTGLRQSELLGLTWDSIDFKRGSLLVCKQLMLSAYRKSGNTFSSPKSGKSRTISPAPIVFEALRQQRRLQTENQLRAGGLWSNPYNLVFTAPLGAPLEHWTLKRHFKDVTMHADLSSVRFHDLRHTYAVNAIRAGDDIKTIQGNLGHASAAFTLDKYGHFTEQMKKDSAARMEGFTRTVLGL